MPVDKAFDNQTKITVNHDFVPSKQWQRQRQTRKKREIRVFVSSTFRDFRDEREEIIKKAFREVRKFKLYECVINKEFQNLTRLKLSAKYHHLDPMLYANIRCILLFF